MKVMMTPPLNARPLTIKPQNVYYRCFTALATLALLAGGSADAQIAEQASTQAAIPSFAFPVTSAPTSLDLGTATFVPGSSGLSTSDTALPEDPGARVDASDVAAYQNNGTPQAATTAGPVASIYTKYVPAGWAAQHITARDKVVIGIRDLYSPLNFAAIILTAGYEQALNGEPNYGVDRGAFGERLGAAGLRETTQGFFTDSVFAPILHEDPRYYVEGPQYGFFHRTIYAATRPLITRSDSGHSSVNAALLLGYASSSALTYAYYPQINRNFRDTASTFGGAIGGAALGFFVSEFSSDVLVTLHLKKPE
jgi:hypothetical protein